MSLFFRQADSFKHGDAEKHQFFYAWDSGEGGKKQYGSCQNKKIFMNELNKLTDRKHFYEQIREDAKVIEFYDMDGKLESKYFRDGKTTADFICDFSQLRNAFVQQPSIKNRFGVIPAIRSSDMRILITHPVPGKPKFSLHIMIRNGMHFKDIATQKQFQLLLNKFLSENHDYIHLCHDHKIYTKSRCFRVLYCYKRGQPDRPIVRYTDHQQSRDCPEVEFFATHIDAKSTEIVDDNEFDETFIAGKKVRVKKEKKRIINQTTVDPDKLKQDKSDVGILLKMIIELIQSDKHVWADAEVKGKMCYADWSKLVLNVFNCCNLDETICREYYVNYLHDMYRHQTEPVESSFKHFITANQYTALDFGRLCKYACGHKDFKAFKASKEHKLRAKEWIDTMKQRAVESVTMNDHDGMILSDEEYVNKAIYDKKKCTIVQAGLGRGKTYSVLEHIRSIHYDRIIIITPRKSFAKSMLARFNASSKYDFDLYMTVKRGVIDSDYLVIQTESLHRLDLSKYTKNGRSLLLCDEISSILFQMASSTHGKNLPKNFTALTHLFTRSSKVICCDAFIHAREVHFMSTIFKKGDVGIYKYTRSLRSRSAVPCDSDAIFIDNLKKDLKKGKRIYLYSTSKTKLEKMILPAVYSVIDSSLIKTYFSNNGEKLDLSNINDEWQKYKIICCTATITIGCNFDVKDVFDKVYIFANAAAKNLVRDVFQSSYRVRHLNDNQIVYRLDDRVFGKDHFLPLTARGVHDAHVKRVGYFEKLFGDDFFSRNCIEKIKMEKNFKYLHIQNELEQNVSVWCLRELFEKYLKMCNYEVIEELKKVKDTPKPILVPKIRPKYIEVKPLLQDEVIELKLKKKKDGISEEENYQLEKYHFTNYIIYTPDVLSIEPEAKEHMWQVYINYGQNKFNQIRYEKGIVQKLIDYQSGYKDDQYIEKQDDVMLMYPLVGEIVHFFRLKHSQDTKTPITEKDLIRSIPFFEEKWDEFHGVFKLRDQRKSKKGLTVRNVTELLKKILGQWGWTLIKKSNTGKGKKHKNATYHLYTDNPFYGCLVPRGLSIHIGPMLM